MGGPGASATGVRQLHALYPCARSTPGADASGSPNKKTAAEPDGGPAAGRFDFLATPAASGWSAGYSRGSHNSASATTAGLSGARRLAAAGRVAARRGTAVTLEEPLQTAEQVATASARIAANGLAAARRLSGTARRLSNAAAGLSGTAGRLAARRSTAAVTVEQALQAAEQVATASARIAANGLSDAARRLAAAGRLAAVGRTATAVAAEEAEAEGVGARSARRQHGDRTQCGRSKTQVHEGLLHETGRGGITRFRRLHCPRGGGRPRPCATTPGRPSGRRSLGLSALRYRPPNRRPLASRANSPRFPRPNGRL